MCNKFAANYPEYFATTRYIMLMTYARVPSGSFKTAQIQFQNFSDAVFYVDGEIIKKKSHLYLRTQYVL